MTTDADGELNQLGQEATVDLGEEMVKRIQELSEEFDELCQRKHSIGEQKYGAGTWLGVDTFEMILDELADMSNYARFSYIRVRMMQEALGTDRTVGTARPGSEMLGKDAFMSAVGRQE